ncbi:ECF transporter S component [Mycoplasmatota bacterium]|nr:ECF transporter S component [Mycoplasmatota bacterium]
MKNTRELVLNAIFIALIMVMTWVPQLGYIQLFPTIGITIIHIPVIIGALVYKRSGFILGTAFGLSSLFVALTRPSSPIDLLFQNPLVSVLPRILFGLVIYYLYTLLNKYINNVNLTLILTAFLSTLIHSILVLFMIYVFGIELLGGSEVALRIIGSILVTNASLEALAAILIGVPIIRRLHAFID